MQDFELNITLKDWLKIIALSLILAPLLSIFIYLLLALPLREGLIAGLLLGLYLGLLSFTFIHLNNKYLLSRIKNGFKFWWWFLAFIASVLAGALGFYLAFHTAKLLNLQVPPQLDKYFPIFTLLVGLLNYLIGLLIFLFINMRNRKETLLRKTLYLRNLSYLRMVESHFLSNLINNIVELMHRDLARAENALIKLAKYLRFILDERDLITLAEELELVKMYIDLQSLRFGNAILFSYNVDNPNLLNLVLPKFSVQLLIENAIKHGYRGKPLQLILRASENHGYAEIELENDGEAIQDFTPGSGLKLLAERLDLHLKGRLELLSQNPVCFKITLPLKKASTRHEIL